MQQSQKNKIARELKDASNYQEIYNVLKKVPSYKDVLQEMSDTYQVYYNPKNHRFETDTSDHSHFLDCQYDDVKECIMTVINEDL